MFYGVTLIVYTFLYSFLYSLYLFNKKSWDINTRIISTVNALQCTYMVVTNMSTNYYGFLYQGNNYVINSLFCFAAYLFVDGIFYLPEVIAHPTIPGITSLLHHFIGGIGIYLMADMRVGLGLGLYFAGTEISTPLLNLSWYTYKYNPDDKTPLFLFYLSFFMARILTIPILIHYIYFNMTELNQLDWVPFIMGYGGSGTLMILNILWFAMLSIKISFLNYNP